MLNLYSGLLILVVVFSVGYIVTVPGRRAKTLPHGPPTLPILGNLHQIPTRKAYIKFAEWAKKYGEIYSLKVASGTIVVISSRRLAKEIMDKHSNVSSARPPVYAVETLVYKGDFLLLMDPSNPRFRLGRKLIHQLYMATMVEKQFVPFMNAEAVQLMKDLLDTPEDYSAHSKRYTNSVIMCTLYGIRTPSIKTPHLLKLDFVATELSRLILPGRLPPVDIFPFLQWVPERFLGYWRSQCLSLSRESDFLYDRLLKAVVERRKTEGPKDTYADRLFDAQKELKLTWHELLYMTGVLLDAGTDTTWSAWIILVQMLTLHPEVLKDAQQQIDSVVGEDRSPDWDDFEKLPIVNQLMKEVQRFRAIVPIAFPHRLSEGIKIDGYYLPKNTDIIVNLSGLHHDEQKFPDSLNFNPRNYKDMLGLASNYANAADYDQRDHYGYGFGRRLCPGIHLAERSLFLTFAKLIWGFDIRPTVDEDGRPLLIDSDYNTGYTDGSIVHPVSFKTNITVRSEKRKETLLKEFAQAEKNIFPQFMSTVEGLDSGPKVVRPFNFVFGMEYTKIQLRQ